MIYLLVYVDDIIITGYNDGNVKKVITLIVQRFSINDLDPIPYFLRVKVTSHPHGLLLSQHRYIMNLLACTCMTYARPVTTPLGIAPTLDLYSGTALSEIHYTPSSTLLYQGSWSSNLFSCS